MNKQSWLVGVDEAGRGPLAGPVAIGIVKVASDFDWSLIPGVGDSKKISPKKRGVIFKRANALRSKGMLDFLVLFGTAKEIDRKGIAVVIKEQIEKGLKKLDIDPGGCFVKLDGALCAPSSFSQKTIIKGDALEPVIGLASICAKVTRDEYMLKEAIKYPQYKFEQHKGYGTKIHREAIQSHGLSDIHRTSYCHTPLNNGII